MFQVTAETAYDMLSPGPSVRRKIKAKGRRKRYHQPQDIREGMTNAYNVVKEVNQIFGTYIIKKSFKKYGKIQNVLGRF